VLDSVKVLCNLETNQNSPLVNFRYLGFRKPMLYPTELRAHGYHSDGLLQLSTLIQLYFNPLRSF
jgi:hypothetical protein